MFFFYFYIKCVKYIQTLLAEFLNDKELIIEDHSSLCCIMKKNKIKSAGEFFKGSQLQCSCRSTEFLPFQSHGRRGSCSHRQIQAAGGAAHFPNTRTWTMSQQGTERQSETKPAQLPLPVPHQHQQQCLIQVLDITVLLLLPSRAGLNLPVRLAHLLALFISNHHKVPHTSSQCLSPVSLLVPPSKLSP